MKIGEIYGTANNKVWKSISSSGMMYIEFKRRKLKKLTGCGLNAIIKYNKFMSECQTWLDLEKNTLTTPEEYEKNSNCSWLLTSNIDFNIILYFNFLYVSFNFLST